MPSAPSIANSVTVRLVLPADSTLRRDVDVPDDLRAVAALGPGRRTAALLPATVRSAGA